MPIKDIFKVSRKTFFNPSGWIDYEYLKQQHNVFLSVLKPLFTIDKAEYTETFQEAMTRLNLTDTDVQQSISRYKLFAIIFFVIAILTVGYSFYLLYASHYITAWLLGVATGGLFLAQAFKYHFWAFQMKRRELGATFAEWRQAFFHTEGKSV